MAINPNTTFSAGAQLTADQMNRLPWGVVGVQTLTSDKASTGTHTTFQDTGMTLTLTLNTSRLYRAQISVNPYPSGGVQGMSFQLLQGASVVNHWNIAGAALETGASLAVLLGCYFQPSSGTSTIYKIQFRGNTANTQVNDYASATQTRQFWIEDMGPA